MKYPILQFFEYAHLPPHLQDASRAFCNLAHEVANAQPGTNAETAAALRKLLEAKDCAVRAEVSERAAQCPFIFKPGILNNASGRCILGAMHTGEHSLTAKAGA